MGRFRVHGVHTKLNRRMARAQTAHAFLPLKRLKECTECTQSSIAAWLVLNRRTGFVLRRRTGSYASASKVLEASRVSRN